MKTQISNYLQRYENKGRILFFIVFAVFLLLSVFQKQRWDSDIFWALKSGQWIFENLQVPDFDPFSYTFGGSKWIDFTWGFQVIAHIVFTYLGGWFGLAVFQFVILGSTFIVLWKNFTLLAGKKRTWFCLALLFLVLAGTQMRFFIRPHLFGFLFVSLYLLLLNLDRLEERKGLPVYLLALLPLQILWVNIHSSFILGIFLVGSYAIGSFVSEVIKARGISDFSKDFKRLFIISLLIPLVSVINPYGAELVVFPFIHQSSENVEALQYIGEWMRVPLGALFFDAYPFSLQKTSFLILLYSLAFLWLRKLKEIKLRDLMITSAFLYMATSHARWIPLFAFISAPMVATYGGYFQREGSKKNGELVEKFSFLLVLILTLGLSYNAFLVGTINGYGLDLKRGVFPEGSLSFIKDKEPEGAIYNKYVYGGYLIYNDIAPFIDGRTPTVYSPYHFWKTRQISDQARLGRLEQEHGFKVALISTTDKVCSVFEGAKDWSAVVFDDTSVLYLKNNEANKELISRWGFNSLNPCSDDERQYIFDTGEAQLKKSLLEVERVLGFYKKEGITERFITPLRVKGLIEMKLGKEYQEQAVKTLQEAFEISSDPFVGYDLGIALNALERRSEALEVFKTIRGEFSKGNLGLGVTYYELKDYVNAVKYLERHATTVWDKIEKEGLMALGLSCFEVGDFECSIRYLTRAAFSIEVKQLRAKALYYLGNSYLEIGDIPNALKYYRFSVEEDDTYEEIAGTLIKELMKFSSKEDAKNDKKQPK